MVKHLMVEQWNKNDGTVDYLMVEQWNRDGGTGELKWLKWLNSGPFDCGTVEQSRWNGGTSNPKTGGTGQQRWWNSGRPYGGREEHLKIEQ